MRVYINLEYNKKATDYITENNLTLFKGQVIKLKNELYQVYSVTVSCYFLSSIIQLD